MYTLVSVQKHSKNEYAVEHSNCCQSLVKKQYTLAYFKNSYLLWKKYTLQEYTLVQIKCNVIFLSS